MDFNLIQHLHQPSKTKIVLLVMDGLGGLPGKENGSTELEAAHTPNLDALARKSVCGLHVPAGTGITPGSGPAHLALFGYDPVTFQTGRGVLAALGTGFDLGPKDVAARGNFCTVDENGRVLDRRAGRISTEKTEQLCRELAAIDLPDVEIFLAPVKDYRFLLVLRGDGLSDAVGDTDPQTAGNKIPGPEPLSEDAGRTVEILETFLDRAREVLAGHDPANMVLLRGFSSLPDWPAMTEVFGLRGVAIARYPMYLGVSRLVGMTARQGGETLEDQAELLKTLWNDFDFFFLHVKEIDSAGEDGDFRRKTDLIQKVDPMIPEIMSLEPDVLLVTGDHSTPSVLKSHSWHPVPALLYSPACRPDRVRQFGEGACLAGALGPRFPAADLLPLALAHAGRLRKFGA